MDTVIVRCAGLLIEPDGRARVMSYYEHTADGSAANTGERRVMGIWVGGSAVRRVPFDVALTLPPICHGVTMVTEGGWRQLIVELLVRNRGIPPLECDITYLGEGGRCCYVHDWCNGEWAMSGQRSETDRNGHCPHQPIVALLRRRHGLWGGQPVEEAIVRSGIGLGVR